MHLPDAFELMDSDTELKEGVEVSWSWISCNETWSLPIVFWKTVPEKTEMFLNLIILSVLNSSSSDVTYHNLLKHADSENDQQRCLLLLHTRIVAILHQAISSSDLYNQP